MVREGPRLTGGTRKPGRGRGISLVPRASNAQQQQQQQQLIQQLQRQLNQQQSPQRQNHEEATISDPTISVDQSNESILAALLSLGKPQQTFKIQYQQSQHYQPQHSQSNSNTQQQLHFNQSQAGYSNQTLESDQKRAQEQHILKQQYDLNQQRQMQQLQKSIPNQQSQHQQQELGLPPQSPSFQTSTTTPINPSGGNQQANSVQALLNTPIPQATKGPMSASPAFFNMNPHSQAKFKKPAPPGTPLHVHSMNASIMSNSLNNTSSSKPKRNGPIHSLLMQSPSFNHPSTGSSALLGGKSPMIGHTLNNRMHPYPQLQQRLNNNNQNSNHSDNNNFSVNNMFSNNALLGMPSPVPAYPAMTPAFHNQGQMQDFFAIGGLVGNGAASPFIRHQNDTLFSMNQHQQQQLQDGQLMQQGFLGNGGATQFLMGGGSQLFADASVLNSPAFGPISGVGFGMGGGDDDISAMNGLLFGNGMNSGAVIGKLFWL
ncbi:hypothetical protein BDR26DRAFT_724517 [Obelidium mucronatum]|nr:hypothetical protein BDR26DRAFT_724517 [Obelidium mucronatum]